jgi:hypothetical protein
VTSTRAAAMLASPPAPISCRKCGLDDLRIVHGPYGYYFKCQACQGNTPIKETCQSCSGPAKVSKSKQEFYLVCSSCQTKSHYWTNR